MNTPEKKELNQQKKDQTVGHSMIEFLTVIVKYRKFFVPFVLIITISATAYALLAPKWYKSTTSVLPAERTDFLSAFSGLSALAKNFSPTKGLAALTGASEFDRYLAILKSSTMVDDVIKRFNLRKAYDMEDAYYEKVVKAFFGNLELEVQDEGNLILSVYDKDPKRAANIANYMIEKLNQTNTELSVSNAKSNREFIEKRYMQNINDVNSLELDMKNFQEKYGLIAVPEQLETTIKSMALIYSELAQNEIELNVLKRTFGENNPLVESADLKVQEIKNKINDLSAGSGDEIKLLIPFKQAPKLSNEYLKIYRDLEIQYKILEFVQPLYEQAKVEEIRNSPSVIVLDKAGPAERKSKPKGTLYLLISFISSSFIGLIIIFTLEGIRKIKTIDPARYEYMRNALTIRSKKKNI